jgi:DNA-directed RNA polymerase specialized sigma subunit
LGNEAKWMCLNIYNKNKRKPIFNSEFIENINPDDSIKDETLSESLNKDSFNKILKMIRNIPDKRVNKIFNMRYIIGKNNKVMPWKQIGASMNLSIQGCINIHNSAIKQIQKNLQKEIS